MFTLACQLTCSILGAICHTDNGTEYSEELQVAYNHGSYGNLFMDPYFTPDIENLNHQKVLDAGCGNAAWAIYAAKQGGEVYAIDMQSGMIQIAEKSIQAEKLTDKIFLTQGDVAALPYEDNFFDKAISIFVACNLPLSSFEQHFLEFHRTLKENGVAVIGAPNALDAVFSDGSKTETEVFLHIQEALAKLPDHPSAEQITEELSKLDEVMLATFYVQNNRLALVANTRGIQEGEKIWRKLPGLVVPNFYYSYNYYMEAFKKCNLDVIKIDTPHFASEDERIAYNKNAPSSAKLGQAYVGHAPCAIFHLKKAL